MAEVAMLQCHTVWEGNKGIFKGLFSLLPLFCQLQCLDYKML